MSTRKQREMRRLRRMEFDRQVEEARKQKNLDERLGSMTRTQLITYAEENGIKIDKTAKKAEILEKIKE